MIDIRPLTASESTLSQLSALLIDVVAGGGSVSFMHPLAPDAARAFWDGALMSAAKGERIVLGAWDNNILTATLTLLLHCPPNQPHRAELAKMMTLPTYRGRGIAKALAQAAEQLAIQHSRTLLMLDTASEDGAAGLYEKLGLTWPVKCRTML